MDGLAHTDEPAIKRMTGVQLREWRVNQGITQMQAAHKIGVSYATYKRWEVYIGDIPQPAANLIAEWVKTI